MFRVHRSAMVSSAVFEQEQRRIFDRVWIYLGHESEVPATYEMPATDAPDGRQGTDLFIIADDMQVLRGRVTRLNSVHAYAESPHSRTRHFVSNVQAEEGEDDLIAVKANFLTTRTRKGLTDTFIGRYEHELKREAPTFRFHRRRAVLDHDALRPHGRVTIIL